jgi:hypothetical protein
MAETLRLFTRREAADVLRIKGRTLRILIAEVPEFAGRRMTDFTEDEIVLIRKARQCRSTSHAGGPAIGTPAARSGRAAKASRSMNSPQDAAHESMLRLLHPNGIEKNAPNSSRAGPRR